MTWRLHTVNLHVASETVGRVILYSLQDLAENIPPKRGSPRKTSFRGLPLFDALALDINSQQGSPLLLLLPVPVAVLLLPVARPDTLPTVRDR